ncbi:MAG: hypothetical protein JSR80_07965, partial [Verrucomicrobia bacterium]|nr:hypothetical protein [Verrucomicrobiota bacterium]
LWGGSLKAIQAARQLSKANALMTMRTCARRGSDFEIIAAKIEEKRAITEKIFGKGKIQAYNQDHVLLDENKFRHIFDKEKNHYLERLARGRKWQKKALKKITDKVLEANREGLIVFDERNVFEIQVKIKKHIVTVRGAAVNNELRYSTIFIKDG